jgi:hypothetical protein
MNNKARWTFRILFILAIIYHIWSFILSGFDAFAILKFDSIFLTIIASGINYLIQIGLPLLFLYLSFPIREGVNPSPIKVSKSDEYLSPESRLR